MRIKNITYRLPGFYKAAVLAYKYLDMSKTATNKFTILEFAKKHGMAAASDHAGVSPRTIRRWRLNFARYGTNGLHDNYVNMNRNPAKWHPLVKRQIRDLRTAHPNLGAGKIKVLLSHWCVKNNVECPSRSTIERIIAAAPDKMRSEIAGSKPRRVVNRIKKNRTAKGFKTTHHGHRVALDTIVRIVNGLRYYIVVAVDIHTRMAVAIAGSSSRSNFSANLLSQLPGIFGCKIDSILTDNGSEFSKHFATEAKKLGIKHFHTYPRTPKANAHCERFNRTLWEEFARYRTKLLNRESIKEFNKQLLDWLIWYNCKRPHEALGYLTPEEAMVRANCGHFDRGCTNT